MAYDLCAHGENKVTKLDQNTPQLDHLLSAQVEDMRKIENQL